LLIHRLYSHEVSRIFSRSVISLLKRRNSSLLACQNSSRTSRRERLSSPLTNHRFIRMSNTFYIYITLLRELSGSEILCQSEISSGPTPP
jgi:hypothetical protein